MKFKMFNMTWSLWPIVIFIWVCIIFALVIGTFASMLDHSFTGVLGYGTGSMLWAYISSTVAANNNDD